MGKKSVSQKPEIALHYSAFVKRLVERESAPAAARAMARQFPGRSATYWMEHVVTKVDKTTGVAGPPLPLNMADIALLANAFHMDPFDLVDAINANRIDDVPRLVGGGLDDEPTPLSDEEEQELRQGDLGLAAKRGRAKKTWGNIAGVDG